MNKYWMGIGSISIALLVSACGGGSSSGSAGNASSPSHLGGTVATGSAVAGALVTIRNASNQNACVESSIVSNQLGVFDCTLNANAVAPLFIVVTDPTGIAPPLASIATSIGSGSSITANATPLTTAIIAQMNGGALPADISGIIASYDATKLSAIKTNVKTQLDTLLAAIGLGNTFDVFSTTIQAATSTQVGNLSDFVLDIVKVVKDAAGNLALATIYDQTPTTLATENSAGSPLPAPSVDVSSLSGFLQELSLGFTNCFALPLSQRVTLNGGGSITSLHTTCRSNGSSLSGNVPDFLQDGKWFGRYFYEVLTDSSDRWLNAKVPVPQILAYEPASGPTPAQAFINLVVSDTTGLMPRNYILTARQIPGSSTVSHPSDWWLVGNQNNFFHSISPRIERFEFVGPHAGGNYQNGLEIRISANPGSPNYAAIDAAHVTGPGLPSLGLWYFKSNTSSVAYEMAMERTSTFPSSFTPVCNGCFIYNMSRTLGLSGGQETQYRSNNGSSSNWSHGYATEGSYDGYSGTRPKAGDVYTLNFYTASGSLVATEYDRLFADLTDAVVASKLPWYEASQSVYDALDPSNPNYNGAISSLPLSWNENFAAEPIKNIWASQTDGQYGNGFPATAKGTSMTIYPISNSTISSTSGAYSPNGTPITGYREIGVGYRTIDGTTKAAHYYYDPY